MIFHKKKRKRLVVIGIDGVPYTFLKQQTDNGRLPRLAEIFRTGDFRRMNSVHPTVSSVAWSSYMTGKDPGWHNIFGFVDRTPNPFNLFIPTAKNMKAETLWESLSRQGKRVVVMNVPVTYPPRPVNGILIGGFLGTEIDKIGYPPSINEKLRAMDYRIDVDAWKGREQDKAAFFQDLDVTLDKRVEVAEHLMETEDWDFFQVHIMETDRINHFLWEHWASGAEPYGSAFLAFYERLDRHVGRLIDRIKDDPTTCSIIMSDHGFCSVKQEVYLNHWLEQEGYLTFDTAEPKNVKAMHPKTRAYSLIPGRVFVNLKGREEKGSVEASEVETLRDELAERLLTMTDPDSGDPIIQRVFRREEIYSGPCLDQAADLIAVPYDGYDLKGNVGTGKLTHKGELVGMHTYDDASVFVSAEYPVKADGLKWVGDVGRSVLAYFGVEEDGR